MALATRCPSCNARFRVAADQLKLRAGLVRCGACQHVFDATGTLSYVDDAALSTSAEAPAAVGTVIAAIRKAEALAGGGLLTHGTAALPSLPPAAVVKESPAAVDHLVEDTVAPSDEPGVGVASPNTAAAPAMADASATAEAEAAGREGAAVAPEPAESAARTVADAGTAEVAAITAPPEPAFLRPGTTRHSRVSRLLLAVGSVALALLLLAQLAVTYRAEILARFPHARPALGQLCKVFRCSVDWPARRELLAIVGSELQALPGTSALELTAVVRNRGNVTVALPAIELTLSDTLSRTVARRVFAPTDYLVAEADPEGRLQAGLEAGADLTVRITFEARAVNPAGFVVYPFYL